MNPSHNVGADTAASDLTSQVGHCGDIRMPITVELDRKVMAVRDILNLKQGSVVKMRRSAGENIDILVGDVVVGCGSGHGIYTGVGRQCSKLGERPGPVASSNDRRAARNCNLIRPRAHSLLS